MGPRYAQAHTVLPAELDSPFDPTAPHLRIRERIPASDNALPIPEWRVELVHLIATSLGIRWPIYPG